MRGGCGQSWSKCFASQVHFPVTELIVTRRDKAVPLAVYGMEKGEGSITYVVEFREVRGLWAIFQE